jgi:type IV pilus assembly protein PilV
VTILGKVPRDSGFTLVEILVAVVIFTTALLGIAGLTIVIIRGNTFSSMLTTATFLAQDKLEALQDAAYSALSDGSDTATQNNIDYTRLWEITDNAPAAGMKTIEVTVRWQVLGKHQRQVLLRTIRSGT